jgi:Tfp pilus assembly protein PilO
MALLPPNLTESYRNKAASNPVFQIILVLIVLVLFSWFIFRPQLAKFNESRAAVATAEEQLNKVETDRRELNRLVNELHSSPDEITIVDEALPLNGRISKAYVLLDTLVRASGMSLAVISADDAVQTIDAGDKDVLQNPYQPGRTLHTITIAASVTGTMEQLKNLLQNIETNGRLLDVDSLQILGGSDLTKFRLSIKAYSYEYVVK